MEANIRENTAQAGATTDFLTETLGDAKKELDRVVREEGETAAFEAGVPGLHPEILKLLGRLKFRYSFGQNQHGHSIETSHLAGMIAADEVTIRRPS